MLLFFNLNLIMNFLHLNLLKQIIRNPINFWYIFIYVSLVLGSKCVYIYTVVY